MSNPGNTDYHGYKMRMYIFDGEDDNAYIACREATNAANDCLETLERWQLISTQTTMTPIVDRDGRLTFLCTITVVCEE